MDYVTRATASSSYSMDLKTKEITQVWRDYDRVHYYNLQDPRYKEHTERMVQKETSGTPFVATHDTPKSVTWYESESGKVTRISKDGKFRMELPVKSKQGRYLAGLAVRKGRITTYS